MESVSPMPWVLTLGSLAPDLAARVSAIFETDGGDFRPDFYPVPRRT